MFVAIEHPLGAKQDRPKPKYRSAKIQILLIYFTIFLIIYLFYPREFFLDRGPKGEQV